MTASHPSTEGPGHGTPHASALPPATDDGLEPADVLGEVWPLLDELPRAVASPRLTATTVEMAAVSVGRDAAAAAAGGGAGRRLPAWIVPAAVVALALAGGLVAGRLTTPRAARSFADLPLVQHLDLLQEAGSEAFLEQLAARRADLPVRGGPRFGGELARRATDAFDAQVESLRDALVADRDRTTDERRAWFERLPLDERHELEKAAVAYRGLSRTERELVAGVAAALVDPARPELREAARIWHTWLSVVRPTDRPEIIGYGTDKRLAWIDWYVSRLDQRNRPPGGASPGGGPAGSGLPSDRLPREWERRGRPPGGVRPGAPPPLRPGAAPPPAETRAPPR